MTEHLYIFFIIYPSLSDCPCCINPIAFDNSGVAYSDWPTILAAAMLPTGATDVYATEIPFGGGSVTVRNKAASAVFAAGKDRPVTKRYFYDADGNVRTFFQGLQTHEKTA